MRVKDTRRVKPILWPYITFPFNIVQSLLPMHLPGFWRIDCSSPEARFTPIASALCTNPHTCAVAFSHGGVGCFFSLHYTLG